MKSIIFGANGRNGINLQKISADAKSDFEAVALVDSSYKEDNVKTFCDANKHCCLDDVSEAADVLIDFSHHSCTSLICKWATKSCVPLVIATTGQTPDELLEIDRLSKLLPVFKSANMSVGVGITCKLVEEAARKFSGSDIEIVEAHHNKKLDAPSGTALMFAESAKKGTGSGNFVCGRKGMCERKRGDIGISSVRMGNIIGEHSVFIDNGFEQIEIKHTAHDRMLFAQGAVQAAKFLQGKTPGLYAMEDLLCS